MDQNSFDLTKLDAIGVRNATIVIYVRPSDSSDPMQILDRITEMPAADFLRWVPNNGRVALHGISAEDFFCNLQEELSEISVGLEKLPYNEAAPLIRKIEELDSMISYALFNAEPMGNCAMCDKAIFDQDDFSSGDELICGECTDLARKEMREEIEAKATILHGWSIVKTLTKTGEKCSLGGVVAKSSAHYREGNSLVSMRIDSLTPDGLATIKGDPSCSFYFKLEGIGQIIGFGEHDQRDAPIESIEAIAFLSDDE